MLNNAPNQVSVEGLIQLPYTQSTKLSLRKLLSVRMLQCGGGAGCQAERQQGPASVRGSGCFCHMQFSSS